MVRAFHAFRPLEPDENASTLLSASRQWSLGQVHPFGVLRYRSWAMRGRTLNPFFLFALALMSLNFFGHRIKRVGHELVHFHRIMTLRRNTE